MQWTVLEYQQCVLASSAALSLTFPWEIQLPALHYLLLVQPLEPNQGVHVRQQLNLPTKNKYFKGLNEQGD